MKEVFELLPQKERRRLEKEAQPEWTSPMLAKLTHQRFSDPNWLFERKLDGERCLAFRKGPNVRLLSRNKKKLNDTYPELAEALSEQSQRDFILDGEIVAFDGKLTSFSRLQGRMQIGDPDAARRSKIAVYYYLFDILHLDGRDLTSLELRHRKALLKRALTFKDPLRFTPHRNKQGEQYFQQACEKGWEGLIAKRVNGPYLHSRSGAWLKFKCEHGQEFVIGGYTDPQGARKGFGALQVGYYKGDDLIYAGKVGTGYDEEMLKNLSKRLASLEIEKSPFTEEEIPEHGVHWVKPELVAEIGFTEWTRRGKLRHPRFLGLRRDKKPKEVVREEPESEK